MFISNFSRFISANFLQNNRWQTLPFIALGLVLVSANLKAEEEFSVDWSAVESSALPQQSQPDSRIAFVSKLSPSSIVVGPATEPANPFPDSEASLYVNAENPADGWFRLVARHFAEESATQGAVEFEFRLVKGMVTLSLGYCDQPWIPGNLTSYNMTDLKFLVIFNVDQEVQIRAQSYQTSAISTLKAGENYRFLIKWDMSTAERYSYFLNGEPLAPITAPSNQAYPVTSSDTGINSLRITLGGPEDHLGAVYLGPIKARSMPVDLYSPEGLIGK